MKEIVRLMQQYGINKLIKYNSYYRKKLKGKLVDQYIPFSQMYYPEDIGSLEYVEMRSGKTGIYEITNMRGLDDWGSKNITMDFVGYKGMKPIRECSLNEFMNVYEGYLK